jgi:hypothetical protein
MVTTIALVVTTIALMVSIGARVRHPRRFDAVWLELLGKSPRGGHRPLNCYTQCSPAQEGAGMAARGVLGGRGVAQAEEHLRRGAAPPACASRSGSMALASFAVASPWCAPVAIGEMKQLLAAEKIQDFAGFGHRGRGW